MTTCEIIAFFRQTKPIVRGDADQIKHNQWTLMACKMAEALNENKELFLENCEL